MNLYDDNAPDLGEGSDERQMTFEEYQEYRASVEHVLKQSEMAERLAKNSDFQALIMEDYFTREPARLGSLMASGRLRESDFQACIQDLRAVGNLRTFLSTFIQKGNIARTELANLEEARKAAMGEDPAED